MSELVPPEESAQEVPTGQVGASSALNGQYGPDTGHGRHSAGAGDPAPAAGFAEDSVHDVVLEPPAEVEVGHGETLVSIARRWGLDPATVAALNAWLVPNPDSVFPGQILRLR